ncbi:vacuolar iron transporter homolog 4-like [Rutidosis leptorrhynchoides]|uniref:vacuolar iron transporter homolog 4-like n=1 Tax=Rutidosis leptorrhynchoides TaxID=125765 RepID=UPI003A991E48
MATINIENSNIEIEETVDIAFNYAKRAQWLRAALLGANDGLLSTATIMMGVGAVSKDIATMIISGIATLVGGACSMAIGEFVSVYSQYDIEMSQFKRDIKNGQIGSDEQKDKKNELPSPTKAALASACAFAFGALMPLLAAAFIHNYHVRLGVVVGVVSVALIGFGCLSAFLGGAPMVKPTLRILIGGWLAMTITFGLTKAVGSAGLVVT